jgi:hypothetical protein
VNKGVLMQETTVKKRNSREMKMNETAMRAKEKKSIIFFLSISIIYDISSHLQPSSLLIHFP